MKKKLLFLIIIALITPASITKIAFEPIMDRLGQTDLQTHNLSIDTISSSKQQISIINVQNATT